MLDKKTRPRILATLMLLAWTPAGGRADNVFDADPAHHALIVVDARVQRKALLAAQDSPIVAGTLRVRTTGARKQHDLAARALAEVLVFAVEPGRYRPASVTARAPKMQVGTGTVDLEIPLPTDSLRALEQTLAAGAIAYVGRIEIMTIPRAFRYNEYHFALAWDAGRERQVWEQLLAKGKPGAWEGAIQSRLDAITLLSDSTSTDSLRTPVPFAADSAR